MNISKHIEHLLYKHDCVILPTLGGFVVNEEPSHIDFVGGKVHPPKRQVSFNQSIIHNDGLLFSCVAERAHLSFAESRTVVETFIEQSLQTLEKNGTVEIEGIGRLFLNIERKLEFASFGKNFSIESFGLPELGFYPILRNQNLSRVMLPETSSNNKGSLVSFIKKPLTQKLAIGIPSAAAVLLCIWWATSFFNTPKNDKLQTASIISSITDSQELETKPVPQPTAEELAQAARAAQDVPLSNRLANEGDDEHSPVDNTSKIQENATFSEHDNAKMTEKYLSSEATSGNEYIIMVGSFGSEGNAKKLSSKIMKAGLTPYSDRAGKLHRIGIRVACGEKELAKHLDEIKQKFNPKSWVLK